LTTEQRKRKLRVEGRSYFNDGDEATVLAKLVGHYSPSSDAAPDLYSADALKQRYDNQCAVIQTAVQSLTRMHEFVSGKLLLTALHHKLLGAMPGYKIRRLDIVENLMVLASKQIPEDIHFLVEERILPRWRRARAASEA
jgi:hypothetical protein